MKPTLLNTRPQHQAAQLDTQCAAAGYTSLSCPALAMIPQTLDHRPNWDEQDVWVFVSRNAVTHFAAQLRHNQACKVNAKLVAVGDATAQAIGEQAWPNLQPVPDSFDSEGMLSMPVFAQPKGLRVGVVRGDGGRELLAQTLVQQGAEVRFYEVYQRQPLPFCDQAWLLFKRADCPVLLFTSASSLQAFWSQLPANEQAWCQQQILIVFSSRIEQAARELGFCAQIIQTQTSSDDAVLQALNQLAKA